MMPTSVLGHCRLKALGFTLLEMMVVLVIIGISLSLYTPQLMKNDEDMLKEESIRLAALLEYAADTASSQGVWLAWSPTTNGYRFLQYNDDKNIWQPVIIDEALRERQLVESVHLDVSTQQETSIKTNALIPLSPSGIQAPFQIVLRIGEKIRVIRGNLLGQITILQSDLNLSPAL